MEKLRPNSSKFKATSFKPSCFAEIKVKDTWDVDHRREEFNERAFEGTDNELSDAEDFYREDTASEFSGSEAESKDDEVNDGPKIFRYKRARLPVEDYRAKLGLSSAPLAGEEEMEAEEEDEEVESIGGDSGDDGEASDEYVVDEAADVEEEEEDDENDDIGETVEKQLPQRKQSKKASHRDKMVIAHLLL